MTLHEATWRYVTLYDATRRYCCCHITQFIFLLLLKWHVWCKYLCIEMMDLCFAIFRWHCMYCDSNGTPTQFKGIQRFVLYSMWSTWKRREMEINRMFIVSFLEYSRRCTNYVQNFLILDYKLSSIIEIHTNIITNFA